LAAPGNSGTAAATIARCGSTPAHLLLQLGEERLDVDLRGRQNTPRSRGFLGPAGHLRIIAGAGYGTVSLRYAHDVAITVSVPVPRRQRLVRRARLLAWTGNAWHLAEFGISLGAGVAASSIALIGFGLDALVEMLAGLVVVWRFSDRRDGTATAERRAQQLIAVSFFCLAAYVAAESIDALVAGLHPGPSWVGVGLAAFTAPTMPLLAAAKRRVGRSLASAATVSEAGQNMLCAYLSVALLAGLLANALAGWWWADPGAALVISALALREGRASWRGNACCESC
jgi:Cation efflux family